MCGLYFLPQNYGRSSLGPVLFFMIVVSKILLECCQLIMHPLLLLFLFPGFFLNDFFTDIPYLVAYPIHIIIGQTINWGFSMCFSLLVCPSCWFLPLIFPFFLLWGLSFEILLLMGQAYLLRHFLISSLAYSSYGSSSLLSFSSSSSECPIFSCWGFPPIFPIIHN
jgi:hypothetical protein